MQDAQTMLRLSPAAIRDRFAWLAVSQRTLDRWAAAKRFPVIKVGGRRYVAVADLQQFFTKAS